MSVVLTINGQTYDYPTTGDEDWGPEATDWAVAVSSGLLQKTGGLFQLLAEVDFGSAFGIKSLYYKSRTTNVASTGNIRLAVSDGIYWRNNTNSGNLGLTIDASDNLLFNGNILGGISGVQNTDSIDLAIVGGDLEATLNISSDAADVNFQPVDLSIETDGLKAQISDADIFAALPIATNLVTGLLSNTDWVTFNSKQSALTFNDTNSINVTVSTGTVTNDLRLSVASPDVGYINATNSIETDGLQTQVPIMVGDSGSGGASGTVPAPASGDAAANKFLKADGTWVAPSPLLIENAQTGTTYTLALSDAFKLVTMANASECTLTVPANGTIAFPIGTVVQVMQTGAGSMIIEPAVGVTVNSLGGNVRSEGQYAESTLVKVGTNSWYLYGELISEFIVATGGTITTDGDYKVHSFTTSSNFIITAGGGTVESLVIAGGGSGGSVPGGGGGGGGGGAGGLIYTTPGAFYGTGTYAITVGAGGTSNTNGNNSVFDTVTASGGGAGGNSTTAGQTGGSGGGGSGQVAGNAGGTGTGGQGNNGGTGNQVGSFAGGGGGGRGGAGGNSSTNVGGNGGTGTSNSITGSAVTYASGGGGGTGGGTPGTASAGGGANGANNAIGIAATANTGGGGGGAGGVGVAGGAGGSGIVILRYKFQ